VKLTANKLLKLYQIKGLDRSIESTSKQIDEYSSEIRLLSFKADETQGGNLKYIPIGFLLLCFSSIFFYTRIRVLEVGFIVLSTYILVFTIGKIISTQSAKVDLEILEDRKNRISTQLTSLRNRRYELQEELSTIENRMRENKCS
jgi:chaperonin cofactor prefoldin